jgi:glutathionylspermidine amidase/synthetase
MFLQATNYVLNQQDDPQLLQKFRIPEKLWPMIRESWNTRRHDTVSGRFDYCLTDDGLKVYEYNADSASALMECGYIQDRWARGMGLSDVGRDSGDRVMEDLVAVWKYMQVEGTLHMLHDTGEEEEYHTLYMKAAAERAGIACKVVCGVAGLRWGADGGVEDESGVAVRSVWKTWSWTTAVDQLGEAELDHWPAAAAEGGAAARRGPRLVDVLLGAGVRVMEPLWAMIPSSKAILPVLCGLFPDHPYLLPSAFEPTAAMAAAGCAAKPISGRGGANVALYGPGGAVLERTAGAWARDACVFQELRLLPKLGGESVQVNCFTAGGAYLATVLRADSDGCIIGMRSAVPCLRIAPPAPAPPAPTAPAAPAGAAGAGAAGAGPCGGRWKCDAGCGGGRAEEVACGAVCAGWRGRVLAAAMGPSPFATGAAAAAARRLCESA